jgi:dimethylargininase
MRTASEPGGSRELLAVTRGVSASLPDCEVTWIERTPIDVGRAREQHAAYNALLGACGLRVVCLPALDDLPDAVFVEDPVHVLDEAVIALSPGASSRRPEVDPLVQAIAPYRPVVRIEPPATVDGGDVLRIGRTLYVGRSSRTNASGIRALENIAGHYGYRVVPVDMKDCLHLKSGCTSIGSRVLINPAWIDADAFADHAPLFVPAGEPAAADVLLLPGTVIMPAGMPETRALIEAEGVPVRAVDVSEFQKAEAGVTCLSVIFVP